MAPTLAAQRRRVLLVEDYPLARSASVRVLRRRYEVTAVASGELALATLQPTAFDVLLTDFQMPSMTGIELLEIVRMRVPRLRRVLMSGGPVPGISAYAATGLVQAFLYKPFDLTVARDALEPDAE
jgi:CheY-like chemotaxis protein